ncbi:3'-5' exonuclease [Streptomyces sp. AA1529]|uniref:3'-5' exonuclease n=1 Tax=Streptomyces sp. AA1529 TaxID=1203257 RepID=UPI0002F3BCC9|nr:hypothetical protein [Streptomyces sp. AA1529]
MTALAFTDTETTHLDPQFGDAWEIAVIRRDTDGTEVEYLWQVRVPLYHADPEALAVGRYRERFAVSAGWDAAEMNEDGTVRARLTMPELLHDVQEAMWQAVVVGSNPGFDIRFLTKLLQEHNRKLPWHYRPVDIATLAAGYAQGLAASSQYPGEAVTVPYSSRGLSRAVGVEPPGEGVAHTALGDARWARDVYDAVVLRRTAAERGETAGGTCGAKLTPRSGTRPCVLPAGHPGHHQDQHTNTWPNSGGAS